MIFALYKVLNYHTEFIQRKLEVNDTIKNRNASEVEMKINHCLDTPATGSQFSADQRLEINGWALNDKMSVNKVQVLLDGIPICETVFDQERPDVLAAYGKTRSKAPVGYACDYILPKKIKPGKHTLEIVLFSKLKNLGVQEKRCVTVVSSKAQKKKHNEITPPKQHCLAIDPENQKQFQIAKKEKLAKIKPLLQPALKVQQTKKHYNFLSSKVKNKYRIQSTDQVSQHEYDSVALPIIESLAKGMILDCGSGKRLSYYPNVVNFEIVPYATTDVLGVNEELPFQDNVFDAVFSLSVLEHVKNPFQCAAEIMRVLKPGGQLYCVAPFLQPLHAYPDHYYNMSMEGLRQLFGEQLDVHNQEVQPPGKPIWALSWILRSWAAGLTSDIQEDFLNMRVRDLLDDPVNYLEKPFVNQLSEQKNIELATTTALMGRKKTEK